MTSNNNNHSILSFFDSLWQDLIQLMFHLTLSHFLLSFCSFFGVCLSLDHSQLLLILLICKNFLRWLSSSLNVGLFSSWLLLNFWSSLCVLLASFCVFFFLFDHIYLIRSLNRWRYLIHWRDRRCYFNCTNCWEDCICCHLCVCWFVQEIIHSWKISFLAWVSLLFCSWMQRIGQCMLTVLTDVNDKAALSQGIMKITLWLNSITSHAFLHQFWYAFRLFRWTWTNRNHITKCSFLHFLLHLLLWSSCLDKLCMYLHSIHICPLVDNCCLKSFTVYEQVSKFILFDVIIWSY